DAAGHEGVGIDGVERIDALEHDRMIEDGEDLPYRAAGTGHVEDRAGEGGLEDRLPQEYRVGLPVALERPHFLERAIVAAVILLLGPGLLCTVAGIEAARPRSAGTRWIAWRVGAALLQHVEIAVVIVERDLVVNEEVAASVGYLLELERIVDDVIEDIGGC